MRYFDIRFFDPEPRDGVLVGELTVGEFSETFQADSSFWSAEEYRQSWRRTVDRLVNDHDTACLITSLPDPATANFIETWPLYRDHEQVRVQNRIVFGDELDEAFDPDQPWRYVDPYSSVTEDDEPASEWVTTMASFIEYLDRTRGDRSK
jgi:hypothetical protein